VSKADSWCPTVRKVVAEFLKKNCIVACSVSGERGDAVITAWARFYENRAGWTLIGSSKYRFPLSGLRKARSEHSLREYIETEIVSQQISGEV
jgi:hypothetical protein